MLSNKNVLNIAKLLQIIFKTIQINEQYYILNFTPNNEVKVYILDINYQVGP